MLLAAVTPVYSSVAVWPIEPMTTFMLLPRVPLLRALFDRGDLKRALCDGQSAGERCLLPLSTSVPGPDLVKAARRR